MNPLKTLQTSPARANDLFAQLAAAGPGAVKTRERLFAELREELELMVQLEHDHVLPVLKKQTGAKTLAARTGERLRQIRSQLRGLADAPKDGDAFVEQVAELKAAFQEHLRDEKSALLPKLQRSLSDDEAVALAERIETARAEVEASARHEAEVQRANARRQREREEAREAEAEAAEREARRVEREERAAARAVERTAQEAVEQTARAVAAPAVTLRAAAERSFEQATETTRSFAAAAKNGAVFAEAAQEASREWMSWAQTRVQNRVAGFAALAQCRTPQDLIALQSRLVREDVELLVDAGARITRAAARSAEA